MENSGAAAFQYCSSLFNLCIPVCDERLVLRLGRVFNTVDEGEKFYEAYAQACGFETRKSTLVKHGEHVKTRYILCNREGSKDNSGRSPVIKKCRTSSSRVGCMAQIVLHFEAGIGYRVTTFNEGHTHVMISKRRSHLMKFNRKVDSSHQIFIQAGLKANIGPIKTFRLYKEICGSYEDVGATSVDFKNYGHDLQAFVDGADAQIVLDDFKFKKESCVGFHFDYHVDEAGKVDRLFWVDPRSIKNYQLFGDAVSLDATYNTNRYKLVFTPFTGRDNHGRCVTFAAALIFFEDVESYTWILEKFVECVTTHPKLIITDQDPALRKVVPDVLPNTHHRFCLWHITKKIPNKISVALREDPEFKIKLDGLIWSEADEPFQFEESWRLLMEKYGLVGDKWFDKWFSDMFELRHSWIPAYFRDVEMSRLFKTTSLSESENSFFKRYLNRNADLVRFQMHFNSAMDAQRASYKVLTHADETKMPTLQTQLYIEQHASTVYTINKFYEVQEEICCAVFSCLMPSIRYDGDVKIYEINDGKGKIYEVSYDEDADFLQCDCKLFIRRGIPCRHLIYVMRTRGCNEIPTKYIMRRWSKLSHASMFDGDLSIDSDPEENEISNHHFFSELCKSIVAVNKNIDLQKQLLNGLKELSDKFSKIGINPDANSSKQAMFETFYGCKLPERIDVLPPDVASNKGSGSSGRLKSNKEKAMEAPKKNLRNCKKCNRLAPHDSRNCPGKNVPLP